MNKNLRDAVILVAASLAVFLFWMTVGRDTSPQYFAVWFIACVFAMNALAKAFWRDHFILKQVTWLYLAAGATIGNAIFLFMSNSSILGYWTIPAVIGLGLAYAMLNHMVGPRFGDDDGPAAS